MNDFQQFMRQNSGSAVCNHTLCINNNKKAKTATTKSTVAAAAAAATTTTDNNTPHETNCIKRWKPKHIV
jgi:hypothetical protein